MAKDLIAQEHVRTLMAKHGLSEKAAMKHMAKHGTKTIEPKKKGQKPITFKEGGLHASTGTASGKKISASKHAEAKSGKLGPKAQKQEQFYENVLKK
jgi:hypothetical protein